MSVEQKLNTAQYFTKMSPRYFISSKDTKHNTVKDSANKGYNGIIIQDGHGLCRNCRKPERNSQ
ncbi:hypothetical protein [uncultured Prevotella sp.]|uniref:hypothetical protein n=1 Tax=uncultured Prevotella sp. TaxID=159272 RepID=UPI0025E52CE6|nr:hypothetical protein [uncultured Prevotella sp.]